MQARDRYRPKPEARYLSLLLAIAGGLALILLALLAFWPTYFSRVLSADQYTHFHASLAALWLLMLAAQPMLIRAKRLALHRLLGAFSYALAPLLVVSVVLLAHSKIKGLGGEAYAIQTYILYLQVSLTLLFGLSYALAVYKRHTVALHARFMVCTAFTMIDPVVIRLMFWVGGRRRVGTTSGSPSV